MKHLLIIIISISGFSSLRSQEKCTDCHDDLLSQEIVHPIAEDGCEICHESNGKDHPSDEAPWFKLSAQYPDLCYMCHDEKNNKQNVHYPVSEGDCSTCHSPHSSSHKSLILSDYSENCCIDCHSPEIEGKMSIHGPAGMGECQSCHDPHQSDFPGMTKAESNDLCLSCHNQPIQNENKSVINIGALLADGNSIHDPILNGECSFCHMPHSSDYNFLLNSSYPADQYVEAKPESFEICFICHDSEMITSDSTDYATNFRNGRQNLHFLHTNGEKGRNCNLCHNVHGAPNPHMIEEFVLYGKWEMPMKLELSENGGSCATGCHKKLEYSRIIE